MVIKREIKTTVPLSIEEQAMLQKLADAEGVSTAHWIRAQIRRVHGQRFGSGPPQPTVATLRGLITDLTGRAHYTAENIAERMGVDAVPVLDGLARLERRGLVFKVDGTGGRSTWECRPHARDTEKQCTEVEKKHFDLDAPLE